MKPFTLEQREAIKRGSTLNAIQLSLQKWIDLRDGEGTETGASNCALCVKFHNETSEFPCYECPLGRAEYGLGCDENESIWQQCVGFDIEQPMIDALRELEAEFLHKPDEGVEDE